MFVALNALCAIMSWYNYLESCLITNVLTKAISRKQDDEKENAGLGKSKNSSPDFGIWPIFLTRRRYPTSPWWAPETMYNDTKII